MLGIVNATLSFFSTLRENYYVFGSVVVSIFQIIFRVKMHANNIFLYLKNYF
jgi:hypothetical protein